jgi:hypothetical protein
MGVAVGRLRVNARFGGRERGLRETLLTPQEGGLWQNRHRFSPSGYYLLLLV